MNRISTTRTIGAVLSTFATAFIISKYAGFHVTLFGHSMAMNILYCVLAVGLAFCVPKTLPELQKRAYLIAGGFVFLFAALTMSQNVFDYSLGIDQLFFKENPIYYSPFPGRMADNASIAFMLIGLTLILIPFNLQRFFSIVLQVMIFAIEFFGISALIGYLFNIDFLYGWYHYTAMSFFTAACVTLIGIGLWSAWKRSNSYELFYRHREDKKILLLSCVILFTIALSAGLMGFIVSAEQNETTIEKFAQQILNNKTIVFQDALNRALFEMNTIQSNMVLHDIVIHNTGVKSQENFSPFAQLLLKTTFAGFEIKNENGQTIYTLGHLTENAPLTIPLNLPYQAKLLLKNDHYLLSMVGHYLDNGKVIATFTAEWQLGAVDALFLGVNRNVDLLLCNLSAANKVMCVDPATSSDASPVFATKENQTTLSNDILNRRFGVIKGTDVRRANILAMYNPIGNQALGLLVKTNSDVIYRPLLNQLETVLPILFIAIMIGALLLYWRVLPLINKVVVSKKKAFASSVRLRAIMDHAADAIVTFNEHGNIESFNPKASEIFGYPASQIIGKNIAIFIPNCQYKDAQNNSYGNEYIEAIGLHNTGQYFPVEYAVTKMKLDNQLLYVGIIRDVSDRRAAEEKLLESENRFRSAFNSAASGVAIVSLEGRWLQVNQALCQMIGYSENELLHTEFKDITHPDDIAKSLLFRDQLLEDKTKHYQIEKRYLHKNGQVVWVLLSVSLIYSATGKPLNFIVQIQNITKLKHAEEQLTYQAYYDSLTGLANRSQLEANLAMLIANAERSQKGFAVFFMDLDKFKIVNDTLGHDAGDMLLRTVGKRLKQSTRATDTVARIGGDEFVLVLMELDIVENAAKFAEKILNELLKPIKIKEHELFITTSIGISFYPVDGMDSQTLIKNADMALYHAKEKGRNNYQFSTPESSVKIQEKMAFEGALKRALDANEFELFYQSKIELRTGKIVSVEALLRWHSEQYGMVGAAQIISMTEESGLSIPLGDWIIKSAVEQTKKWQAMGAHQLNVAINISPRQFKNPLLATSLSHSIHEAGINPKHVILEVTESLIMQDPENSIDILRSLKAVGVQVAIDNFGTGYSSLNYLQRFGVEKIKIDKSFVRDLPHDPSRVSLVNAMIGLAKSLNIRVVAEGVETKEQYEFLSRQGCDEVQGFYISRPVSVDEETLLLEAHLTETSD